jgi:hypothetical protein
MKYKMNKKKYFKIKLFDNGKFEVEEVNETNFQPIYLKEIYSAIGDKKDYYFTCCEEEKIEKTKAKIVNYLLKDLKKDLDVLTKKYNSLLICQSKLINF